jgi:TM2 domain-containing membrane protein YozV
MKPVTFVQQHVEASQRMDADLTSPHASQWFTFLDGQVFGPLTLDEMRFLIKQGRLTLNSEITRRTPLEWKTAGGDELLTAFFQSPALSSLPSHASAVTSDGQPLLAVRPPARVLEMAHDRDAEPQSPEPGPHVLRSPLFIGILSLVVPGLGQLIRKSFIKAIAFGVGVIMLWGSGLGWIIHIWAAIDAAQSAVSDEKSINGSRAAPDTSNSGAMSG